MKIRPLVLSLLITIPFFLFYYVNCADGDNGDSQEIFDCTKWNVEVAPRPIYFIENRVLSFESADLRVAGYRNPEKEKQICVRYFLESTRQILWQMWNDANDVHMSAVLFENGYVVQPNAQVKWRIKGRRDLLLVLEVGIFTEQQAFLKSETFIIALTNPEKLTFF